MYGRGLKVAQPDVGLSAFSTGSGFSERSDAYIDNDWFPRPQFTGAYPENLPRLLPAFLATDPKLGGKTSRPVNL